MDPKNTEKENKGFLSRLFNMMAPRACTVCGCRLAEDEQVLCLDCNLHLPRTHFVDDAYENPMASCFWGLLPVERCAALFFYQAHSQVSDVIYALKYRHHPEYGELMGQFTAQEFLPKGFFDGVDLIIPVPLAARRQRQRGYNQSMEIARGVSLATGIPIEKKAVKRLNYKGSQTQKDRWQRTENVEGAFRLTDAGRISGRHVLLVDDVVTTGATVCSCGGELMKADDVKISVLSLGFTKR
jgi:ComF family protein